MDKIQTNFDPLNETKTKLKKLSKYFTTQCKTRYQNYKPWKKIIVIEEATDTI